MPFSGCCPSNALKDVSDGHLCWMPSFSLAFIFSWEAEKGGLRHRACAIHCPSSNAIFRVLMNRRLLGSSDLLSCGEIFFLRSFVFFGFRCRCTQFALRFPRFTFFRGMIFLSQEVVNTHLLDLRQPLSNVARKTSTEGASLGYARASRCAARIF